MSSLRRGSPPVSLIFLTPRSTAVETTASISSGVISPWGFDSPSWWQKKQFKSHLWVTEILRLFTFLP
jgi:hypothetical protein